MLYFLGFGTRPLGIRPMPDFSTIENFLVFSFIIKGASEYNSMRKNKTKRRLTCSKNLSKISQNDREDIIIIWKL